MKPVLFIITGSNGAGKSAVGASYLPDEIQKNYPVFDADKLALQKKRELFPSIKSLKEARKAADEWVYKLFSENVKRALQAKDYFAYEGHFRDSRTLRIPLKFKRSGYDLCLIFMGVMDPDQSELRVLDRAKHGGHHVPLYEIESNFYGNLVMLNKRYRIFNELLVIDTSKSLQHKILLHIRNSEIIFYTPTKDLPKWFIRFLPSLTKLIKKEEKPS